MQLDQNLRLSRYEWAAKVLAEESLPVPLVYDIGCGFAPMREPTLAAGLKWRGFEQEARELSDAWDIEQACPFPEKAGAVLLLDVLEHLPSPGLALKNIAGALAPGGKLILSVPNPRWSASRLYMMVKGYASSFTPHDLFHRHLFPIWPHVAEALVGYAGMEVESYVTLDGPTKIRPAKFPIDIARLVIEGLDRESQGMSYGIVAKKVLDTPPGAAPV